MSEKQKRKERERTGLSGETEELLRAYFDAFANLYGIMPLYRAFRIIRKQNPELVLTEEEFLALAGRLEQENHYYIIAGEEDIYEDAEEPTPPMKREIIAEHLYAVNGFESYAELKEQQEGKPFYIPEKEKLLRYQNDLFVEETEEVLALSAFLRDGLKLERADDVLWELALAARCEECDLQRVIGEVERLSGRRCFGSMERVNAFLQHYLAMYNNTRFQSNRGFTPAEMQEKLGGPPRAIEFGPNISRSLQDGSMDIEELRQGIYDAEIPLPFKASMLKDLKRVEQKKPGRNDPCPCGSGKKYKRCCGR